MNKPSAYTADEWARMRSGGVLAPRADLGPREIWQSGYDAGYDDGSAAPSHDMGYNRGDTPNPYKH